MRGCIRWLARGAAWRSSAALVALTMFSSFAPGARAISPDGASVPTPEVTGPVSGGSHGWPYGSSYTDLTPRGYVEEEFFFEGTARNYGASAPSMPTAPYRSRMVVRRPVDPARFNGTVLVEWLNVTAQKDTDGWNLVSEPLALEDGYVQVAVSAQKVGVDHLRGWDSERYGSLQHPGDDFSWDVFSQAAKALVSGTPTPLGGLTPEFLVAIGGTAAYSA